MCAKHKVDNTGTIRYPREYFHEVLGLAWLRPRVLNFPWAKACCLVREPNALATLVRFDEQDVETEFWILDCGTARRKGRQQLRRTYHHRATSRL